MHPLPLNRAHVRETIFHDDEDRTYFLRLLARRAGLRSPER
jgi:hypothetical protein